MCSYLGSEEDRWATNTSFSLQATLGVREVLGYLLNQGPWINGRWTVRSNFSHQLHTIKSYDGLEHCTRHRILLLGRCVPSHLHKNYKVPASINVWIIPCGISFDSDSLLLRQLEWSGLYPLATRWILSRHKSTGLWGAADPPWIAPWRH